MKELTHMHRTWLCHRTIFFLKKENWVTKFDFVKKHDKSTKWQNYKRPESVKLCLMKHWEFYTFFMVNKKIRYTEKVMSKCTFHLSNCWKQIQFQLVQVKQKSFFAQSSNYKNFDIYCLLWNTAAQFSK